MNTRLPLSTAMLIGLLASTAASAETEDLFALDLDLRYRFENVDDGNFDRDASASTLRSRLGVLIGPERPLSGRIEFSNVSTIGADDYNSGAPRPHGNNNRPVIADPPATQLNQAWLRWQNDAVTATVGRQRVLLGNQRFVGNVGWRQNEQTFLAARLDYRINDSWQVNYLALDRVYRIFGPDTPAGKHDLSGSHLLQIEASPGDGAYGKFQGFHYRIHNRDLAAFSTATTGLRWFGQQQTEVWPLFWEASIAHQNDTDNAPQSFSANYWQAKVGSQIAGVRFDGAIEQLGGSDQPGRAFRTPLATLHAFNGWADRFLATPRNGLFDQSLGLSGKHGGLNWSARFHHFDTDEGSHHLGNELDIAVGRKLGEHINAQLKFADFNSATGGPGDSRKLWLTLATQF